MARKAMGPATLAVVRAVADHLDSYARKHGAAPHLLVACSGGPDSLALAGATDLVVRRGPAVTGLTAVVVDHRLQPDSADVARGTVDQLAGRGISAEVVSVDVGRSGGPEAAARAARYAALAEAADRLGARPVLLGHTLDDQAETVLLGLARGSGARSLAGMAPVRDEFLRPLLGVRRSVTRQACTELGLHPWADPHNRDPAYARVRVRERVLPLLEAELGPGIAEALARTADLLRDDADLLDRLAAQAYAAMVDDDGLSCAASALPTAVRRRVLRRFLLEAGASDVTAGHVAAADRLLTDWHGQAGVDVPSGRVLRRAGRLKVTGRPVAG